MIYKLIYQGITESYGKTEDGSPVDMLLTTGCDCCSEYITLSKENIDKAIIDAEEWIKYLKILREK